MRQLLEHVHRLARSESAEHNDADLLAKFAADREEAAFTALVRRHGPLVLAVCRRWLPNPADADDAFQAVFLVLARRAGSIAKPDRLVQWLYGTAVRTAKHLRQRLARQERYVHTVAPLPAVAVAHRWPDPDLGRLLDDELQRLTEKYRLPVLMCLLHGMPRREAAERLQIPEGTLSTRLAEARTRLRRRLLQRGVAPAAATALLASQAQAVSPALARLTVQAAVLFSHPTNAVAPPTAGSLAYGVLRMFAIQRTATAAAAIIAVTILGIAVSLAISQNVAAPALAADPPAKSSAPRTALKAGPGELLLQLHPTPDQAQMGHVVIVEDNDQFVAHSLRGLRKYLTRLRAAEKSPPTTITLVAPAETKASAVNDVMGVCRDAGFGRIILQSDEPKVERKAGAELYRRLSLDLLGRLPNQNEMSLWLDDKSPDSVRKAVEYLLSREQMQRVWRRWLAASDSREIAGERKRVDELVASLQQMTQKLQALEKELESKRSKELASHLARDLTTLIEIQHKQLVDLRANRDQLLHKEALKLAQDRIDREVENKHKEAVVRGLTWLSKTKSVEPANVQGFWLSRETKLNGKKVEGELSRFRWIIHKDELISYEQGQPQRGRIFAGKDGSLEVTLRVDSPAAKKYSGKYTMTEQELNVELIDEDPKTKRRSTLSITFERQ